ncbi:MAG: hypothetical protein ACMG6S_18720 [Byssovorax sp.]
MRFSILVRSALVALTVASTAALPACSKKSANDITDEATAVEEALTEQHPAAAVTWLVMPDGQVKAMVKSPDGTPLEKGVTGTVTAKALDKTGKPVTAKLEAGAKPGAYTATLPKLEADLTDVTYKLEVDGKPVAGTLHLPRGGTAQLVTSAKAVEEAKMPADTKGPNGGIVQVVGDDVVEIVADKATGQVRVYVLDDDLKPIAVGKRKVKLAAVAGSPELVELEVEPKGLYFTGKFTGKTNPVKLTVVFYPDVDVEPIVVLCGWKPATVIVVGPGAPVLIPIFVVVNWAPVVVIDNSPPVIVIHHGKGKGKWKWKGKHGGGGINIKIH